jgi:hypothetical protein
LLLASLAPKPAVEDDNLRGKEVLDRVPTCQVVFTFSRFRGVSFFSPQKRIFNAISQLTVARLGSETNLDLRATVRSRALIRERWAVNQRCGYSV